MVNRTQVGRKLCLLLGGAAVALSPALADTVTLRPVADAEIQQAAPGSNIGTDPTMVSGALGFTVNRAIRRGLLRFDPGTQIPAGATINSVTLRVRVVKIPAGPANSTFEVRRILQPWTETGVTWNSRSSPAAPWQTPGATGPADSLSLPSATVFVAGLAIYDFSSTANLVADVQAWINNPATNFGWLLISENEITAKTARHFGTREGGSNAPSLVIDFTPPPPVIAVQPQGGIVSEGDSVTLSVVANGPPPLTYQWQDNSNDLPSATNSVLLLPNVQTNDSGIYTVRVRNPGGVVVSQPALLTVLPATAFLPKVSISSPAQAAKFPNPADVLLVAEAEASNAIVSQVEFFANAISVGIATNRPFSLMLSNLSAGNYSFTAQATDDRGRVGNSSPVAIRVVASPQLTLVAPAAGARFPLGTNVSLAAALLPPTVLADIERVEFFEGDTRIVELSASPFATNWIPTVARDYSLKAVATDDLGQTGVSATVTIRVFVPESNRPGLTITSSPPNFARLTFPSITLAGIASDNVGLDHVEWQLNGGPFQPAVGTTAWRADLTLPAGPNTIRVRSVDLAANVSFEAARFFTYVVNTPLVVRTNGLGSVTPNWNGRSLEIGQVYSLSAKPRAGQVFSSWSGVPFQGARLNFVMRSNLVLTANFVPNPFPAVKGGYAGLVLNTNAVAPESSGFFQLQVGSLGAFSGHLVLGGIRRTLAGQLSPMGEARLTILRTGRSPIALALSLDLTNGTDQIIGRVTDGNWTSDLSGNRNVFTAMSIPAPQTGRRSFVFQRTDATRADVGSGSAKISTGGGATLTGRLSDGRKFTLSTTLAKEGSTPFYLSLSGGTEVIGGWMTFGGNLGPPVDGKLYWVKSGTNAFSFELDVIPTAP